MIPRGTRPASSAVTPVSEQAYKTALESKTVK